MANDTAFEIRGGSIRFGAGVTREVGPELAELGIRRVLLVTDSRLRSLEPVQTACESLDASGVAFAVYDRVRIEPSDDSFLDAIAFARRTPFEALVAVGGGSAIDTAKAVNLYTTRPPAEFLDYVNPPIGKGLAVPGPLKPLVAIPTTAGTGSETTGVSVFDVTRLHAKTGIASRWLRPTLGLLDPDHTRTLPRAVAASTGLDVLCHAVESYTALPFSRRPAPGRPSMRPPYQGSNPISDVWSLQALRMVDRFLVRAVDDPTDDEARGNMLLAAAYAGIGFGNAGVHLPHAMSYPVAGHVKNYHPSGYETDHPLVPHGVSVILNAPPVFRFTATADPTRHLEAAAALGADTAKVNVSDAGLVLSDRITWFMRRLNLPNGLAALGYSRADIPSLVEGAILQRRLTALSPKPVDVEELEGIFAAAMTAW
jgi:hydroxyacid-oxoacid transhydrogenase